MPPRKNDKTFSLLREVSNELTKGTEPNRTLLQIAKLICEHTGSLACYFSVFEPRESKLTFRAQHGLYLEEIQHFQAEANATHRAFEKMRTLNISQSEGAAAKSPLLANSSRFHSILAVPLVTSGRPLGVMTVARASRQAYPPRTVTLLETLATQLASFVLCNNLTRQITENNSLRGNDNDKPKQRRLGQTGSLLKGKAIVEGVSIGRAVLMADVDALSDVTFLEKSTQGAEREKEMFQQALESAKISLERIRKEVKDLLAEADASIFEMHAMLLEDPTLKNRILKHLEANYNLDSSLRLTLQEFTEEYENIKDEYLRERLTDVKDVLLRLKIAADNLGTDNSQSDEPTSMKTPERRLILVARELLPTQLLASPVRQVCGIVCESGGSTSHAAILARALRIPMLCNVTNLLKYIKPGNVILLDCQAENCFLSPDLDTVRLYQNALNRYRHKIGPESTADATAMPLDDSPATIDGCAVHLAGNITLFSEMPSLAANGIQDVGLYRTEFMFVIRNAMPDEDEQVRILTRLVKAAGRGQVTIRALDIGGDKPLSYVQWGDEDNPSLGWRGLRFLLSCPDFLRTHLRAILRTAAQGNVQVLFPMVAEIHDLRQVRAMLEEAKVNLKRDGLPFREDIPLGMMLEVPSAIQALDKLLPEVDFVSIGTNDLIQYLFAVDRGNSRVNHWFRQLHPVVFRTLREICRHFADFPQKQLSICGELGGNLLALPVLLGCGIRSLSMNASKVPPLRDYVRKLNLQQCQQLANEICDLDTEQEARLMLTDFAAHHQIPVTLLSPATGRG